MQMQSAIRKVLTKYAEFGGRAQRWEFWPWFFAVLLLTVVVDLLTRAAPALGYLLGLTTVCGLVVPALAVGCRRLHDSGKSGWLQLLMFGVGFGWLALLALWCIGSDPGINRYGSPERSPTSRDHVQ